VILDLPSRCHNKMSIVHDGIRSRCGLEIDGLVRHGR